MSLKAKSIISKMIRCRHPQDFEVGEGSIIDDFCYFSTKVKVGRFSHVANGVSVGGGGDMSFRLGDYSSVSAGVKIWCRSDDFRCDLSLMPPAGYEADKKNVEGDVSIAEACIVGSNTVIMPNNDIPEGVAIGALSFVPSNFSFKPWTLYAGIPIREIRSRDREEALRQKQQFLSWLASQSD